MGRKSRLKKAKPKPLAESSPTGTPLTEPPRVSSIQDEPFNLSPSNQPEATTPISDSDTLRGEQADVVLSGWNQPKASNSTKVDKTREDGKKGIQEALESAAKHQPLKLDSPKPQQRTLSVRQKIALHGKAVDSSPFRFKPLRDYWNKMSAEKKRSFLEVSLRDLRAHYTSLKRGLATDLLSEALLFVKRNKSWKFWVCCRCGEKFTKRESYKQHVRGHICNHDHYEGLRATFPPEVDSRCADMILGGSWVPVDVHAAIGIHKIQVRDQSPATVAASNVDTYMDGSNEECLYDDGGSKDTSQVQIVDGKSEAKALGSGDHMESGMNCGISSSGLRGSDDKQWVKGCSISQRWPSCDDPERAELLERIRGMLQLLLKHNCLSSFLLDGVMRDTVNKLQLLAPGLEMLEHGLNKTLVCMCFLGATRLQRVLRLLQDLTQSLQLSENSENATLADATQDFDTLATDALEGISISNDSCHLVLNEFLLTAGTISKNPENADMSDVGEPDKDAFLSWILDSSSDATELLTWTRMREGKIHRGKEILLKIMQDISLYETLLTERERNMCDIKDVNHIQALCNEESKKRHHSVEYIAQSYEDVLRKKLDELKKGGEDNTMLIAAFWNVLKIALATHVQKSGQLGITSRLSDSDSSNWEDSRIDDNSQVLQVPDESVSLGIKIRKTKCFLEYHKTNAKMRQTIFNMEQLEHELENGTAFDYREIMFYLVKKFLQARLEDLVDKDAKGKSDASIESLLAKLSLEEENNINKGGDNSKQLQEKKKKKKDNSKAKDRKGIDHDREIRTQKETTKQVLWQCATIADDNTRKLENIHTGSERNLQRLEEDFVRKTELEKEEKKLDATLEYKRRIDNEAKRKHLADKYGEESEMFSENVTEGSFVDAKSNISNRDPLEEQLQQCKKVSIQGELSPVGLKQIEISDSQAPLSSNLTAEELTFGSLTPDVLLKLRVKKVPFIYHDTDVNLFLSCGLPKDSMCTHTKSIVRITVPGLLNKSIPEYDEERFQTDPEKATRGSRGTPQAEQNLAKGNIPMEANDDFRDSHNEVGVNSENRRDALGVGMKNDAGDNNCFLNVIVQSLWQIRRFRKEFMRTFKALHYHVGDPCIICALYDIFRSLRMASEESETEAVAATDLRIGLSKLHGGGHVFQVVLCNFQGQENDASEVMEEIFECLHQSFTSCPCSSDSESEESGISSWDRTSKVCIAHTLFGIFLMRRCNNCHLEPRCQKNTSFSYLISAYYLRMMKTKYPDSSFEELLKLLANDMNDQSNCDGCGKKGSVSLTLSTAPHVLAAVLNWQNDHESADDISTILTALSIELDIGAVYPLLGLGKRYCLISVVCYFTRHYCCFSYSRENDQWVMYNDTIVKAIGSWGDFRDMCVSGKWQPVILFYEAVN